MAQNSAGAGAAAPYLVRGAPYLGGREQRRVLTHSAERPKEPLMYTVGYYNDEDFRAFYSGQDAANIDDFFTENGEYLMVYLPEVTDREFLAGLRYGNGCDALCQSGYALDEAEEALATCTRSPCSPPAPGTPNRRGPGVFCSGVEKSINLWCSK